MADDDPDDRELALDALKASRPDVSMEFVIDGQELLDYLRSEGPYAGRVRRDPLPGIILLDLNMPRMDGREALAEIKSDGSLRQIPVVVLTTSRAETDVLDAYDLGASSFITKPATHRQLANVMNTLVRYWFETVELPSTRRSR